MRKYSPYLMSAFYVFAGFNHFRDPEFYYGLIPEYFSNEVFINYASGVLEVVLGLLILPQKTRKIAATAIIFMLVAFIPSHVYFIQIGSCIDGGLCVPDWIGWVRLIIIHPLLIYWAYGVGFKSIKTKNPD